MVRARFAGVTEYHGKQYGIIQFQDRAAGAGREFVGPSKVDRVFFAFDDASSSTEAEEQALGKKIRLNIGLARAFVADPFILTQMLLRSGIDCAIIGVIRAISRELIEVTLSGAAEVGAPCIVGRLQDVVRAGRFVNSGECAHSEIFAPRSKTIAKCAPKLVIFRGAAAYVHQADTFQNAHHLALLSPIEQNFEEGVTTLQIMLLERAKLIGRRSDPPQREGRGYRVVHHLTHPTLLASPPSRQNLLCCPISPRAGIRTIFCASETAVPMRCAVRPCARRIASTRSAEAGSTT
jgi:hypothetical protein